MELKCNSLPFFLDRLFVFLFIFEELIIEISCFINMKKTLVLGASLKTDRYSNFAIHSLVDDGHEVVGVGLREGQVAGILILTGQPQVENVDTVTLYLNASRQKEFYDYVLSLHPKRVIFNPGTKNGEFEKTLKENDIFFENSCTLVLLSTGQY
jgi:predicted CoA-binding protein